MLNYNLPNFNNDFFGYDLTTNSQTYSSNDIIALARAFLSIESMSHKKLQKLCYYAKAWYLAIKNTNIIEEPFEAWVHGAVQPFLYNQYRCYGFNYIPQETTTFNIPEEFINFAQEIYKSYGHLSGDQLEIINHKEDPWINARGNLPPWANCTNVIEESDMKKYYRKLINNE